MYYKHDERNFWTSSRLAVVKNQLWPGADMKTLATFSFPNVAVIWSIRRNNGSKGNGGRRGRHIFDSPFDVEIPGEIFSFGIATDGESRFPNDDENKCEMQGEKMRGMLTAEATEREEKRAFLGSSQ